jgi:hypothetical protein
VDGIANDRAQNRRDRGYFAKPEDVLRPLLIALSGHLARRADWAYLIVEFVQVSLGPVDPDENARQIGLLGGQGAGHGLLTFGQSAFKGAVVRQEHS